MRVGRLSGTSPTEAGAENYSIFILGHLLVAYFE
jgi:hypothetical protein